MAEAITDRDDLAARLAELGDILYGNPADTVEAVAPKLVALRDAGLLSIADRALRVEALRRIAQGCAASAWLVADFAEARDLLEGFDPAARAEVGDALVTVARVREGATIEDIGERRSINGMWHGVGGLPHAQWVLLRGVHDEDGRESAALIRADEAILSDYPYLGGLRGVGWRNLVVDGLSLAAHRVVPAEALAGRGLGSDRLVGALVGCAEGGYDDYVRMTRARITGIGGAAVATFTQVQARLAESEAQIAGATRLFGDIVRAVGEGASGDTRVARDRAYVARGALDAVTRLVRQMGAMGLSETNPVQRRYRDLRTLAADPAFAWDENMARHGRALLGIGDAATKAEAA